MDLCNDSGANISVYKVRHWAHDGTKVFVLVGLQSEEIKHILDKDRWTVSDKRLLERRFGKDYQDTLGRNEAIGINTNVVMVYNTLRYDDNISIVRKKIATWLFPNENGLYMWVERDVSRSEHWIPSMAIQIMQGKNTISSVDLKNIIHNIRGTVPQVDSDSHEMTFDDVKAELVMSFAYGNMRMLPYALEVKRTIDGFLSYEYGNPITRQLTNNDISYLDEMHVSFESSNLLEQFSIVDNIINVITKLDVKWTAPLYSLYFANDQPLSTKETNMIANSEFICNKYNDLLASVEKPTEILECHVSFMHIRFNENISNINIPLSEIFNRFETNGTMPFIKHNLGGATGQKNYKLHTNSLATIKPTFIDDWTETSEKRVRSSKAEYIMIVGTYVGMAGDVLYLTFLLFDDYHIDVKFSNIRTFDITIDELSTRGIGCVNTIVSNIRKIVPELGNQIEKVDAESWPEDDSNVRLINLVTNMRIETKESNPKVNDIKTLASRMYPYVSVDTDIEHDKHITFSYKRISNYANASNIVMYLNKHYRLAAPDLISDLEKNFGLTRDAATTEVTKWQKSSKMSYYQVGRNSFLRPKDYNGITIKMTRSNNGYTANIEGVTSVSYQRRIATFIKYLVLYSDSKSVVNLFTGKDQGQMYDRVAYDEKATSDDDLTVNDAASFADDLINFDDLENGEDWHFELDQSIPQNKNNNKKHNESSESESESEEPGQDAQRYVLKRLQRADKKRFGEGYSKSCQWVNRRQPIVVDEDEKKALHPKSYTNFIEYGRNDRTKKKNIYICPEIWCPISKVSMTFKDFESNNKKCPNHNETPIDFSNIYFIKKNNNLVQTPRYVGFLKSKNSKLLQPCCFKISKKNIQNDAPENVEADDATPELDTSAIRYILGMQYPLTPNRFGILPAPLSDIFGAMVCGSGSMTTGFVTDGTDCFLRRGVSAESNSYFIACMAALLDSTPTNVVKSIIKNVTIDLFITLNDGKLVGLFVDSKRSINDHDEFTHFMKWSVTTITSVTTWRIDTSMIKMLEETDVRQAKTFSDVPDKWRSVVLRFYLIYNAFTSFIAYLEDPSTSKSDAVLWDLFNRQTTWLNPKGINMVIIEVVGESAYLICNYSRDYLRTYNPYAFILKQGTNVYEPLTRVVANTTHPKLTFKIGDHPVLDDIISNYSQSCGMHRNTMTSANATTILRLLKNYDRPVRFQVLDYDLKLVGFIQTGGKKKDVGEFVPVIKQSPIMSPYIACIYMDEIIKYVPEESDLGEAMKLFEHLYSLTKDETYKFDALHEDGVVIGLINKSNLVVPLKRSAFPQQLYLDNLNIFIGLQHPDERTKFVSSQNEKEAIFQVLKSHVLSEVSKTPALKTMLNERDIGLLRVHIRDVIDNIAIEHSNASSPGGASCSAILQPEVCQGECIWHAEKCKIKVKHGLLKRFTGRMINMLLKGRDTLVDPLGKHYTQSPDEITFDQTDVKDGVLADRLEQQRTPYAFLDRILENYVDEQVKLYPLQVGLFTEEWVKFPSPFLATTHLGNMFMINRITKDQHDYFVRMVDKISIAKNFGVRFDRQMLVKLGKNALIALEKNTSDTATFIKNCQYSNGSLANMLSRKTNPSLNDVLECLNKESYWFGQRELMAISELLHVKFVILGRKTTRNPRGSTEIKPLRECSDYVFLWTIEQKDLAKKKTTHDTFELISNPQSRSLIWNQVEVQGVLDDLGYIVAGHTRAPHSQENENENKIPQKKIIYLAEI